MLCSRRQLRVLRCLYDVRGVGEVGIGRDGIEVEVEVGDKVWRKYGTFA